MKKDKNKMFQKDKRNVKQLKKGEQKTRNQISCNPNLLPYQNLPQTFF